MKDNNIDDENHNVNLDITDKNKKKEFIDNSNNNELVENISIDLIDEIDLFFEEETI